MSRWVVKSSGIVCWGLVRELWSSGLIQASAGVFGATLGEDIESGGSVSIGLGLDPLVVGRFGGFRVHTSKRSEEQKVVAACWLF